MGDETGRLNKSISDNNIGIDETNLTRYEGFFSQPLNIGQKKYYIYFTAIKDIFGNPVGTIGTAQNYIDIEQYLQNIIKVMVLIFSFISLGIILKLSLKNNSYDNKPEYLIIGILKPACRFFKFTYK